MKLLYDFYTVGSNRRVDRIVKSFKILPCDFLWLDKIERSYKIKILRRIGIGEVLHDRKIVGSQDLDFNNNALNHLKEGNLQQRSNQAIHKKLCTKWAGASRPSLPLFPIFSSYVLGTWHPLFPFLFYLTYEYPCNQSRHPLYAFMPHKSVRLLGLHNYKFSFEPKHDQSFQWTIKTFTFSYLHNASFGKHVLNTVEIDSNNHNQ